MSSLEYVPRSEFQRVLSMDMSALHRTRLFATLCRLNVLYMVALAGSGHVGTSFSCLDIVSSLFLGRLRTDVRDIHKDTYFSSKGHDAPALYAILTGLGLLDFDLLHRLRRHPGLPGHPDVSVPFMETNTGSLGMGISKAKGMALANRLQSRGGRIYVLTGDGELQEGQIWESLQQAANRGLSEITVIVDHNRVQSDRRVSETSDLGDIERKFAAFGWAASRCDGHDPVSIEVALDAAERTKDRPTAIVAYTVKGSGVSFMEHTTMPAGGMYRYHSGAPSEDDYLRARSELLDRANALLAEIGAERLALAETPRPDRRPVPAAQRLVQAYASALVAQAERNERLVALDGDLVLDCGLVPFRDRFPERFVEAGIAEQDMVSMAGGMALRGLLPVVHSFACFLSTRPNEQIYNNATERRRIVYVGSLAGLIPGGPGHSHQSVRDISALGAIPGLILLEPSSEADVAQALDFCLNETNESCYLRLVSVPWPIPYEVPDHRMKLGKGFELRSGADGVIFGYGPVLLSQAYLAAEELHRGDRCDLAVVDLPWLNVVDADWLRDVIGSRKFVFALDNHYLAGGQGEMIAATLAALEPQSRPNLARFGVSTIPACGTNDEVLQLHGLDAASLATSFARVMGLRETVPL